MGATYRSDSSQEPAQEARVEALSPATRQRLTEAFERGEALAYRRPVMVDHPLRWLVLGVFGAVLPELSFVRSLGHLDPSPFATRLPAQALLLGGCLWGLACGAFALRSLVLRRGALPSGLFLFATSLIESREGRVRVWPTSRLRAIRQRTRLATLDLGTDGRVQLTTEEHDLADLLGQLQEQHRDAQLSGDTRTLVALDPCHAERTRGSFTPITGPAPLPGVEGSPPGKRLAWSASALLVLVMSVALCREIMHTSDRVGIERARQSGDGESLQAYVIQGLPLAAQADEAWFRLAQSQDETHLFEYLHAPFARHVTEADAVLATRVDQRTTPPGPGAPAPEFNRNQAIADLQSYLNVGLPTQPLRSKLETRLIDLTIDVALGMGCAKASDPLRLHLGRSDALGDRVREAQWQRALERARRCASFDDLESARALATTPARQAEIATVWVDAFKAARARSELLARAAATPGTPAVPGPIITQMGQVWAYLSGHPEARMLAERPSPPRDRHSDLAASATSVMSVGQSVSRSHGWNRLRDRLDRAMSQAGGWGVQGTTPYLSVRPLEPLFDAASLTIESVLTLPGSAPQTVRAAIPCECRAVRIGIRRGTPIR